MRFLKLQVRMQIELQILKRTTKSSNCENCDNHQDTFYRARENAKVELTFESVGNLMSADVGVSYLCDILPM